MSEKNKLNPVAAALVATFAASLSASSVIKAEENPFSTSDISSGYMIAEGNCGDKKEEGKCGDKKTEEGKCGNKMDPEGKCGEGKCGDKRKEHEGKCGEGKCGSNKE